MMHRSSLIIMAVLVTLSVVAPDRAAGHRTAVTQPASVSDVRLDATIEQRCARFTVGQVYVALPGNTSI